MWLDKQTVSFYREKAVEEFACPQCLAPTGERCIGKRGKERLACHGPRFDLAMGRKPRDHTVDRRVAQPIHPKAPLSS